MTLTNYINDLLYRYNCVIVPGFGGFVSNAISAKVDAFSHTFYPPSKQLTFNAHLKNNDGLLANYIAASQAISYDEATAFISETVANWQHQLQTETLILHNIGNLTLNKKKQLVFEPNTTVNYLTASFGLAAVSSPAVKREAYQKQATKLKPAASSANRFFKYAASVAVFLSLGVLGWNGYQTNEQHQQAAKQQKAIESKIQEATFVIQNPLPTIELTVNKAAPKNFHIVAGAFQFPENAEKKLAQLKRSGFSTAEIIGKNRWGLTQVTYTSLATRAEALIKLREIKANNSEDAWLLIQKRP